LKILFLLHYFFLFTVSSLGLASSVADPNTELENKIKAVCIFNFAKYVEWPGVSFENQDSPVRVCLVGESPIGKILRSREDLRAKTRPLQIHTVAPERLVQDAETCHIIYWDAGKYQQVEELIGKLKNPAILTVADGSEGSMIQFLMKKGKIRFHINDDRAERAGLSLGSQLLKLSVRD